ncbi:ABC transporter permease [Zobellella endophytica]|uniref:ABC transporter permease n=1 Tax=Zobellella endophytica TaxID=2116700 RepID=A0A2P7R3I3_9GAMM|nr:ABC transporter permease [Zobellella endophytica]PSJ44756.1 ABC transporter permease [Zobellella endophytica]
MLREWQALWRDPWQRALLLFGPLVLFLLLGALFGQGQARGLPVALVDKDGSSLSRTLGRYLAASPTLSPIPYPDEQKAYRALRAGSIYGVVLVPPGFEVEVWRQRQPKLEAVYNGQFMLVGKQVNSALTQLSGQLNAELGTLQALAVRPVAASALGQAQPIRPQLTALYNSNSDYRRFLLSAALPALLQILVVAAALLGLDRRYRQAGNGPGVDGPGLGWLWLSYTGYGLLYGTLMLALMFGLWGWPLQGGLLPLLLGLAAMSGAGSLLGFALYVLSFDPTRGLSLAAALTAPSFAFLGVSFPATDMSGFAQFWRLLLPASHYVELQTGQLYYGEGWGAVLGRLWPLLCYLALLGLIRFKLARRPA